MQVRGHQQPSGGSRATAGREKVTKTVDQAGSGTKEKTGFKGEIQEARGVVMAR